MPIRDRCNRTCLIVWEWENQILIYREILLVMIQPNNIINPINSINKHNKILIKTFKIFKMEEILKISMFLINKNKMLEFQIKFLINQIHILAILILLKVCRNKLKIKSRLFQISINNQFKTVLTLKIKFLKIQMNLTIKIIHRFLYKIINLRTHKICLNKISNRIFNNPIFNHKFYNRIYNKMFNKWTLKISHNKIFNRIFNNKEINSMYNRTKWFLLNKINKFPFTKTKFQYNKINNFLYNKINKFQFSKTNKFLSNKTNKWHFNKTNKLLNNKINNFLNNKINNNRDNLIIKYKMR